MSKHSHHSFGYRKRRGSAILLCTLAAAMLSFSAIAILRSSQHHIAKTDARRSSVQGRQVTDGLVQRCVAVLQADPNATGRITDANCPWADAYGELNRLSPVQTQIRVYLYAGSATPAFDRVVDPNSL